MKEILFTICFMSLITTMYGSEEHSTTTSTESNAINIIGRAQDTIRAIQHSIAQLSSEYDQLSRAAQPFGAAFLDETKKLSSKARAIQEELQGVRKNIGIYFFRPGEYLIELIQPLETLEGTVAELKSLIDSLAKAKAAKEFLVKKYTHSFS